MSNRSVVLQSWLETRLAMRRSRQRLEVRQNRLWSKLTPALAATPALASLAGQPHTDFPITETFEARQMFDRWNSLNLSESDAIAAAENAESGGDGHVISTVVAGYSTGSSGQRGIFLASERERGIYLGQSIAKLLSAKLFLKGIRIALFLRANSKVYGDLNKLEKFQLSYFPLDLSPEKKAQVLSNFSPNIIIAPPHVLAQLATQIADNGWSPPRLQRLFYGAEPIGEIERTWIKSMFGVSPDPIYQATEGFLGAACRYGQLHLNEDSHIFELERVPGTPCFRPVITSLQRTSQPVIRFRVDDLIRPSEVTCPCGFAGRAIFPVEGRLSDLWDFEKIIVTPRELTEVMEQALGPRDIWRLYGSKNNIVIKHLFDDVAAIAADAMREFLRSKALSVPVVTKLVSQFADGPKRRRVRWQAADV